MCRVNLCTTCVMCPTFWVVRWGRAGYTVSVYMSFAHKAVALCFQENTIA